jgi:hypothetical protein
MRAAFSPPSYLIICAAEDKEMCDTPLPRRSTTRPRHFALIKRPALTSFHPTPPGSSSLLQVSINSEEVHSFVVNPEIVRRALEKKRTDEFEYAQLLEDNVPVAPNLRRNE